MIPSAKEPGSPIAPRIEIGSKLVGGEDDDQRKRNRSTEQNGAHRHPTITELPRGNQTENEDADSKGSLQDRGAAIARREPAQSELWATRHASRMFSTRLNAAQRIGRSSSLCPIAPNSNLSLVRMWEHFRCSSIYPIG
jgi:hypothetical protein